MRTDIVPNHTGRPFAEICRSRKRLTGRRAAGFTLLEILVAMTILLVAIGLVLGVYLAALKRVVHSENALKGATEVRAATDLISQAVRSAPMTPLLLDKDGNSKDAYGNPYTAGPQLLVAPKDLGYATVLETTWIDVPRGVKGSKDNQKVLKVSNITPNAVAFSIFDSSARPAGALTAGDVSTYFTDGSNLPTTDLNDLFSVGDTITIPATAYGAATTGDKINSISNNAGNKTLTLDNNLGVNVPNGTKIMAIRGRRLLFSIVTDGTQKGDLRFYPDSRDLTKYAVLARDIDPAPFSDPADTGSARTVPFSISGRYVTLNLQKLPRGTTAGRTVQGVQTTVLTRTDPLAP